ncbi:MAG TPA: phosphoribosylformylglycinamidine cyclo-ligase [Candidatus Paceibacterota bacterium]|nr:phosphoribosylformylglycinamidine cyclo-ligase [Candidatus Paceibacterota bacterium]
MKNLYKSAGVNIDKGNESVKRIKKHTASTHNDMVLTGIGSFGGLFDLKEVIKKYKNPVLVQSIDGVGTKLSVAKMMDKYDTVGVDIVNHCANDLLAMGARSLTFLDYVANEKLEPRVMEEMVSGMARACREGGIALIGGETAEMPGTYAPGEHDIAGSITGIVERAKIITGERIKAGDIILGFASSGLHTNGYSLARKILFKDKKLSVKTGVKELGESVGEALLKVHINYSKPVFRLIDRGVDVRGIAHITGGGFTENIPRVLPKNLDAEIELGSWPVLPIFEYLQKAGKVSEAEMYRVFNMGIGLVVIIPPKDREKAEEILRREKVFWIGNIKKGGGRVVLK